MKLVKEDIGAVLKGKSDDEVHEDLEKKFASKFFARFDFFNKDVPEEIVWVVEVKQDDKTARKGEWYVVCAPVLGKDPGAVGFYIDHFEKDFKEINMPGTMQKFREYVDDLSKRIKQIEKNYKG